jgi:hypothetical protein
MSDGLWLRAFHALNPEAQDHQEGDERVELDPIEGPDTRDHLRPVGSGMMQPCPGRRPVAGLRANPELPSQSAPSSSASRRCRYVTRC